MLLHKPQCPMDSHKQSTVNTMFRVPKWSGGQKCGQKDGKRSNLRRKSGNNGAIYCFITMTLEKKQIRWTATENYTWNTRESRAESWWVLYHGSSCELSSDPETPTASKSIDAISEFSAEVKQLSATLDSYNCSSQNRNTWLDHSWQLKNYCC